MTQLVHLLLFPIDVALASVLLCIYYQTRYQILTLLLFKRELGGLKPLSRRPRWLSTQPSPNPDAIPTLFAQLLGPFPMTPFGGDWNYFCYVYLDPALTLPVTLKGRLNRCRISNVTVYLPMHLKGTSDSAPPCLESVDISTDLEGHYEVQIGPNVSGRNTLRTPSGARHAVLAFRNYVFAHQSDMHYPAVYWGTRLVLPARVIPNVQSSLHDAHDQSVADPSMVAQEGP